jgi:hypothetical protein
MMIEDIPHDHPDYERIVTAIRNDRCPDCDGYGFQGGPRGGIAQNIFCLGCGAGFNVAPPRYILFVQRIGRQGRSS